MMQALGYVLLTLAAILAHLCVLRPGLAQRLGTRTLHVFRPRTRREPRTAYVSYYEVIQS